MQTSDTALTIDYQQGGTAMTQLFDFKKLAAETAAQLAPEMGMDGIGLTQGRSDGVPLTPAIVAEMFPADGAETRYRLAGSLR